MTSTHPEMIPSTMRAWQWTSIRTTLPAAMELTTSAPAPSASSLKPDETLVRVHYSSLNPVDFKVVEAPLAGRFIAWRKPGTPAVDYCGTVVATGANRTDLRPGQLVFGMLGLPYFGALAEYIVAGKEGCVALPDGVSASDAATVGVAALTAWQCLDYLPRKGRDGGRLFINGGSGGVGTFMIQFAKARGCFVATTCSSRNTELCKRLGADEVIDYTKGGVVDALSRIAKEGGAFDLACDLVSIGEERYWQAHQYLKRDASFVTIAGSPALATVWEMIKVYAWPSRFGGGQHKFVFKATEANATDYADIARLMQEGKFKPVVEEIYDMEQAPRAYERLKTGRVAGKLVVKVAV